MTISAPNGIEITTSLQPQDESLLHDSLQASYTSIVVEYSKGYHEVITPAFLGSHYSDVVQTADFRLADYAKLTDSQGKEIPLVNYVADKTFGNGVANRFLFVFAPVKRPAAVRLIIDEWGLGCGATTFQLKDEER